MKYAFYIALLFWLTGCTKVLDVTPAEQGNTPGVATPEFNFLARLSDPSGVATSSGRLDTLTTELYLKQLDIQAPGEDYRLVVTFPATFDGSLLYQGKSYRSGDWITIPYAGLKEFTTLLMIIPYQPKKGTHTLNLTLTDRREQSKTASITIVIP